MRRYRIRCSCGAWHTWNYSPIACVCGRRLVLVLDAHNRFKTLVGGDE